MSNFERKFGKYAINNLPLMMILCYGVGYLISFINADFLNFLALNPYKIIHGQVWRIITWVILPPNTSNIIFTLFLLFCVYSIGVSIERVIGTYQFNLFIFTGILLTVIGAFGLMGLWLLVYGPIMTEAFFGLYSAFFSSYYLYISLFVVFALSFPDARFLFMFFIPVKAKWMVVIYIIEFVIDFALGNVFVRVALVAALLNFGIFWLRNKRGRVHMTPKQFVKRQEFKRAETMRESKTITRHKCAICGRTEVDSPDMQFRFCSKCEGNYEYCEEHLYTHSHVKLS